MLIYSERSHHYKLVDIYLASALAFDEFGAKAKLCFQSHVGDLIGKDKAMNSISSVGGAELAEGFSSMHQLGDSFLDSLPKHIAILKIPGRWITGDFRTASVPAHVEDIPEIQQAMREALYHEVTENAQAYAEAAFSEFLKKTVVDRGVLSFSMAGMRPIKQQAWCRVRSSCVLPQTP